MTMSLDGFVNDRSGDLSPLYPDLAALRRTKMLQDSIRKTGAVVMGRGAYDVANGDFTGYEFQVPLFIVTRHPPKVRPKGENARLKVRFVTEGLDRAMALAKRAAGRNDVTVVGGADILHQVLAKGLADELLVGIVPIFLGGGLRMFDGLDGMGIRLERRRVMESPGRTDVVFRVVKPSRR